MTILSVMTARIADDLARPDLTNQIAAAINDAITHYQSTRFYFNVIRPGVATNPNVTGFDTTGPPVVTSGNSMAWWATYTSSDVSVIGDYIEIDEVLLEDSDGLLHELRREAPEYVYAMLHQTAVTGRPICYAYTEQSFVLYPVPDGTYTINPMGLLRKAAPTDDTAGNVWMTEAFELIRCHAKLLLAVHTIRDQASGELMANAAAGAKAKLERETSSRSAVGRMVATAF